MDFLVLASASLFILSMVVLGIFYIFKLQSLLKLSNSKLETLNKEYEEKRQEHDNERLKNASLSATIEGNKESLLNHETTIDRLRINNTELEKLIAEYKTKQSSLEIRLKENDKEENSRREKALLEFDKLARTILDEKTKTFDETSKKTLNGLIEPLKGEIKVFQEKIETTHKEDLKDRSALKQEISSITIAGKELRNSSDSLARALRGDSKTQGKWGELILEKVLESSGLRKGHEFSIQVSYSGEEGEKLLPDVTLHLSNDKNIFIDAKVSLTHYDKYLNTENDIEKFSAEHALVNSFCERVKELSKKKYQTIPKVDTLDFVIMFTPIESALAIVIQNYDKENTETFFEYAWKKGVIIASPLTLMPVLRTIDLCWKAEYQNKNALKIADEASKLYDKFVGFLTKFDKVEDSIKKLNDNLQDAKRSLSEGTGNLITRTETIRKLLKKERKVSDSYLHEAKLYNEEEAMDTESLIEKEWC